MTNQETLSSILSNAKAVMFTPKDKKEWRIHLKKLKELVNQVAEQEGV